MKDFVSIYRPDPEDRWDSSVSPWAGLSQSCATGLCRGCKHIGCKHACHQPITNEENNALATPTITPDLHVRDLFDPALLAEMTKHGYVRQQVHPDLGLIILNYTEKAQYEGLWNDVTLNCRGLILDGTRVVARPLSKFFNYGDPKTGTLDLTAGAVVVDKLDGSLGILYPTPDGFAVATRGSFTSHQAQHATALFRSRYADFLPPEGVTVLFEIIYPENRIVCDYGSADDLFLLGAVDIATGAVMGPDEVRGWEGPRAQVFNVPTLWDALAMPPRDGAEGLVVRLVESGQMVKIKQATYVALHKVITGLNARGVWELLGAGKSVADICEPLPDEFHQWVKDLAWDLRRRAEDRLFAAQCTERNIRERLDADHPNGWSRKEYALAVTEYVSEPEKRGWLFNLLDGKDPSPGIWKSLRPHGDSRPVTFSEDTA